MRNEATALALALCANAAFAWNDFGHMVVAAVAYEDLTKTPPVRARVDALIKLNPKYGDWIKGVPVDRRARIAFLMASRWPDAIRGDDAYVDDGKDKGETPVEPVASRNIGYADKARHKYWHYKDVGFSLDNTAVESAKVPNAATTITAFRTTLASTTAPAEVKSYDLVWLTHLVGDIHQPLHATSRFTADHPHGDIGGNTITLCSLPCKDKLHAFWDGVLGHDERPAKAIAAAALLPIAPSEGAGITDVDAWVVESVKAAREHVYKLPVREDGHGPVTLDDTYRANAKAVAQRRVALAGARLAHLIRAALK